MPPEEESSARITSGVPEAPTPEAVEKAVRETGGTDRGKVMKVIYLDEEGNRLGEWSSQQIPEDPFTGRTISGLQDPPYPLAQLIYLAEAHPVHAAALEQKVVDVCGTGWEWKRLVEATEEEDDRSEVEALQGWLASLAPDDEDIQETLMAVWDDVETMAWGMFEVVRDPSGVVQRIYHVPAHTVRAHRDGVRLVQIRGEKKIWFRRWGVNDATGVDIEVDAKTGSTKKISTPANDLFVVKRKSRRSSWYGIPTYISAIGYLTLALAARDDNLLFFQNRREPRWAIILSNIADDPNIEADLRRAFTVDLKQPYRSLIIPIAGPGKVEFNKLTDNKSQDGTFDKLADRADKAILIAHRIPGERLANTTVGSLGGNVAAEVNRVYKEGVVTPSQEIYDARLNRFIAVEYEKATNAKPTHKMKLSDLDIETDRDELDLVVIEFHADLITLGEARKRRRQPLLMTVARDPATGDVVPGSERTSPYNDMLYTELPGSTPAGSPGANPPGVGPLTKESRDPALSLLDADVREMLEASHETNRLLRAGHAPTGE